MAKLIAKFRVQLANGSLLVCRDLTEEFRYRLKIDRFEVELCLNPDYQGYRNVSAKSKTEVKENPYYGLSRIMILVTGQEEAEPPALTMTGNRSKDDELRRYFGDRKPAYREVAWTALDRAIRYFKYQLHNPLLSTPSQYSQDLQNPSWLDSTGQEFKIGGTIVLTRLPDLTSFGVKCLSLKEDLKIDLALEKPIKSELYEELLSDAQTAIYEGNLRRGALEMAIACEIAVKQVFFAKSSVAGEAFDYLESKRKVVVSIPELIDGAALQAFGQSFKTAHSLAFESINSLFQCRNKIAHRGEAWYRDKNGNRHELDRDTLATWWNALDELLIWLNNQNQR